MIAPAGQTAALSVWWQPPGVWPQIFSCSSSSLSASSCLGGVVTCSSAQSVVSCWAVECGEEVTQQKQYRYCCCYSLIPLHIRDQHRYLVFDPYLDTLSDMLGHIIQHIIYTVSTFYILSTQYIHSIYTVLSTQYLHSIYTLSSCDL